jgi:hypothetical protein
MVIGITLKISGRRAKKPIHDGSQKNELNGYMQTKVVGIKKGIINYPFFILSI